MSGSGKESGQAYINFARNQMDQMRSKITDELWILNFSEVNSDLLHYLFQPSFCFITVPNREKLRLFILELSPLVYQHWYTEQVDMLNTWLSERLDHTLHPYQCMCLAVIVKVRREAHSLESFGIFEIRCKAHFLQSFCDLLKLIRMKPLLN